MDILSLLAGATAGAGVVLLLVFLKIIGSRRQGSTGVTANHPERSVENIELEVAKRNLKTSLLEKDLLSSALAQVYQAEAEGRITKGERDNLSTKYREQLRELENKLGDVELLIEVGELERLRGEMMDLLERKIGNIETRLSQAQLKLGQLQKPEIVASTTAAIASSGQVEEKVERRRPREAVVDEKVKALRNEVLDALARLEQMDIES